MTPTAPMPRLGRAVRTPWVRALATLWIVQVVSELAFSFALPFVPLYLLELGVADVTEAALWAGAMAGGFAVAMALMGPVWGAAADRFGRRLMIQRALFGACLVIGAMALVATPEQLMVLRVVQGVFTGVVAATTTVVSLTVPRAHLATALGLMHAAMFVGAALGPLVGGAFSDAYGFRAAFAATGGLFLVCGLLVTLFVAEPAREPAPAASTGPSGQAEPARLLRRELVAVVAVTAIIRIAHLAPMPVLPLFVQQIAASGTGVATTVGLVLAATGVASTVSALAVGRIADRYGRRATLIVCMLAAAALSPLHALAGTVGQLVLLRVAMGLALGGMGPATQALLTDLTPPGRRGAAFGMLATASAVGNGGGPVLGSLVAAGFGVSAVFLAGAPVFLAGTWLLTRLGGGSPRPR